MQLINLLHVAPLFLVALIMLSSYGYGLFTNKKLGGYLVHSSVLGLSSIGVIAGNYAHHNELIGLFDPCVGYGIALLVVAFDIARNSNKIRAKV